MIQSSKVFSRYMILICLFFLTGISYGYSKSRDYYQIQTFRLNGKEQEAKVDKFLKEAYLPALHRAGIAKVGVFKPLASDTMLGKRIYVWIPFKSLDHFDKIQDVLASDSNYQKAGSDFLAAPYNQAPFVRKESVLLKAFSHQPNYFTPSFTTAPANRIYELRSYEGPTEYLFRQKVKMFNEGGEIALFKKLDFNAVFYAEVVSGSTMPNLMYLTTFANAEIHADRWATFRAHPEWKALSSIEEYKNTVSNSVKLLLRPADYSDF